MNRRNLPPTMIDLIRDGIPNPGSDKRRTYNAAVKTAMSAKQRGWTFAEWQSLLLERNSELGIQIFRQTGKAEPVLARAWQQAQSRIEESPALTPAQARRQLDAVEDQLTTMQLAPAARLVAQYAIDRGRELGTIRVALPWRDVVAQTGLSESIVKRQLSKRAGGILRLAERGRPGLHGKANLYWVERPTSPVSRRCVGGPGE